jgi:hypothetical protein
LEKTYRIDPAKAAAYLHHYKKRSFFYSSLFVILAASIVISHKYNIDWLVPVTFICIVVMLIVLGTAFERNSVWVTSSSTTEYLKSEFIITDDYIERIYNGKSGGKVRFKSRFAIAESRWGIEVRNYSFFRARPLENMRAEVSNRLAISFSNYYNIYIPTIVNDYDEIKNLLYQKSALVK